MRVPIAIAAVVLVGCGPDHGSGDKDPTAPAPTYYDITGVVFDSVLGLPATALRVSVGDSVTTTSDAGVFHVHQKAGNGFINITDLRFEPLHLPYAFDHSATVTLFLRGSAPYAFRCQFRQDTVTALIVDLQGRKTMDRRTRTLLTADLNQQQVVRTGDKWLWTPLDNITWSASVGLPDSTVSLVQWRLEDLEGNVRTASCDRSEPCTQCQGPQ
ncbi:MAG TPA: hypothetical protein VGP80_05955 [Gemmatimonadales bacterium]|jgi:hypothetical protein|nr:hypothetical protein [Gemmatimonadales bacterium]